MTWIGNVSRWILKIVVPLGTAGCMGMAQEQPRFSGVTQPYRVPPSDVQDVLAMPADYESIGEISVNCHSSDRSDALALLGTIGSCDLSRLVDSLKQGASAAGGEALVDRRCDSDNNESPGFDHKPVREESIRCRAIVARRAPPGMGSNHGVPNSQLPQALRSTASATPSPALSPEVIEATTPDAPRTAVAAPPPTEAH